MPKGRSWYTPESKAEAALGAQHARIHGIDWNIDLQTGDWLGHLHLQLP